MPAEIYVEVNRILHAFLNIFSNLRFVRCPADSQMPKLHPLPVLPPPA